MDTIMKRFRRWLARRELANCNETITELQRLLKAERWSHGLTSQVAARAQQEASEFRRRVACMEPWARDHAPGNNQLLAWAQLLPFTNSNGSWSNTSCVHPFDRWGITPKP